MKKILIPIFFAFVCSQALAASDSVGVFYREDKTVVLINEHRGAPRLQGLIESWGPESSFQFETKEGDVRIRCGTNTVDASCTFRFVPSQRVVFEPRQVKAFIPRHELPLEVLSYEMAFESSMKDQFYLLISNEGLFIEGKKK